ncbi:MAG TPA: RNA methyltransferase [Terracidiphilus sp.]
MLTEPQRDRIDVVLVSPRNPLNIGAAARAMANFGFSRLAVVAPYEQHWREARSAVGAEDLLQNARRTESLAEAVADCTLVVGTGTLDRRKPEQPAAALPDLVSHLQHALGSGGRVALVFGPEKRGLTREDLSLCHLLVAIPTDPRQPSMNLGQCVAVCLYELAVRPSAATIEAAQGIARQLPGAPDDDGAHALSGDLDRLAGVIDQVMRAVDYSPANMQAANQHDLRLLLRRLTFTEPDTRRVLRFFRRVLRRLER